MSEQKISNKVILNKEIIEKLQSFEDGNQGYYYDMFETLKNYLTNGINTGKFTFEEAQEDLETALWMSYACCNLDEYEYYFFAMQWMPRSKKNAKGCGTWYYRYSVALTYCGYLDKAFEIASQGVAEEPTYPWIWLQYAKLLSHFDKKAEALEACDKGLNIVFNNYEFLTLKQEIEQNASLADMEFHVIDSGADKNLQENTDNLEYITKKKSVSCILVNESKLKAIKELFNLPLNKPLRENNYPYVHFDYAIKGIKVIVIFAMNEAGLSNLDFAFIKTKKALFDEAINPYKLLDNQKALLESITISLDYKIKLSYKTIENTKVDEAFPLKENTDSEDETLYDKKRITYQDLIKSTFKDYLFSSFVLLKKGDFNSTAFFEDLNKVWDIDIKDPIVKADSISFKIANVNVVINYFPFAISKKELEKVSLDYGFFENTYNVNTEHSAHLSLVLYGSRENMLYVSSLYVKLTDILSRQKSALLIYANNTFYNIKKYRAWCKFLATESSVYPINNLIACQIYHDDDNFVMYTTGLKNFGYYEIEIHNIYCSLLWLYNYLQRLANFIIENHINLKNGDKLTLDENQSSYPVKVAKSLFDGSKVIVLDCIAFSCWIKEDLNNEDSSSPIASTFDADDIVDDGKAHLAKLLDKNLKVNKLNALSHILIYLKWALSHRLLDTTFKKAHASFIQDLKEDKDCREYFLEHLDGKLRLSYFNKKGISFTIFYYRGQSPNYLCDIDNFSEDYFGFDRYHSNEFLDEAYLFIPYDSKYFKEISKVILNRYNCFESYEVEDSQNNNLTDTVKAFITYFSYFNIPGVHYKVFSTKTVVESSYSYKKRLGVEEGYFPLIIVPSEELWDKIIKNVDPKNYKDFNYKFTKRNVTSFKNKYIKKVLHDGESLVKDYLDSCHDELEQIDSELKGVRCNLKIKTIDPQFEAIWDHKTEQTKECLLASVSVDEPWKLLSYVPISLDCYNLSFDRLMAILKYWYDKYGVSLALISNEFLEFTLEKELSKPKAVALIQEICAICKDFSNVKEKLLDLLENRAFCLYFSNE